jgi:hypothetical protein
MRDSKIHVLPEIPLWPADRVEVFVRERAIEWFKVLVLGEKAPVVSKASSWLCVGGDTPVLTPKGYVPIKDLRIGEQVMTRKGWRSVVDGIARPATGKRVLRYKPFYGMPIYITDDHPILTTLYRHTVAQTQRDGTPEWRTLADLEHYEGMTPKVYLGYRTEERALPEGMTDAHLRLLGAYVADGSLIDWRPLKNGTKVPYKTTIVVGPDDSNIADAIVADVTEAFGGTVRSTHVVRHHRNTSSRVVTIYSRKVAEWLHRWCPGRRAPVKQLADEVLYWPVTSQTALVDAMMRGDGHVGREPGGTSTFTYSTASYQLALQVQELWFRRQLGAAINVRQQKGGFSKSGSTCYTVVHRAGAKATYGKFIAPGIVEVPIQSIEEAVWDTDALVYDITVDGEHEFMTAAGLVHNCKSCSFNGERIPGERCYPSSER